jgi:hypothetical protein
MSRDYYSGYRAYSNKLIDKCHCGGAPVMVSGYGPSSRGYIKCMECAEQVFGTDRLDAGWKWNRKMRSL